VICSVDTSLLLNQTYPHVPGLLNLDQNSKGLSDWRFVPLEDVSKALDWIRLHAEVIPAEKTLEVLEVIFSVVKTYPFTLDRNELTAHEIEAQALTVFQMGPWDIHLGLLVNTGEEVKFLHVSTTGTYRDQLLNSPRNYQAAAILAARQWLSDGDSGWRHPGLRTISVDQVNDPWIYRQIPVALTKGYTLEYDSRWKEDWRQISFGNRLNDLVTLSPEQKKEYVNEIFTLFEGDGVERRSASFSAIEKFSTELEPSVLSLMKESSVYGVDSYNFLLTAPEESREHRLKALIEVPSLRHVYSFRPEALEDIDRGVPAVDALAHHCKTSAELISMYRKASPALVYRPSYDYRVTTLHLLKSLDLQDIPNPEQASSYPARIWGTLELLFDLGEGEEKLGVTPDDVPVLLPPGWTSTYSDRALLPTNFREVNARKRDIFDMFQAFANDVLARRDQGEIDHHGDPRLVHLAPALFDLLLRGYPLHTVVSRSRELMRKRSMWPVHPVGLTWELPISAARVPLSLGAYWIRPIWDDTRLVAHGRRQLNCTGSMRRDLLYAYQILLEVVDSGGQTLATADLVLQEMENTRAHFFKLTHTLGRNNEKVGPEIGEGLNWYVSQINKDLLEEDIKEWKESGKVARKRYDQLRRSLPSTTYRRLCEERLTSWQPWLAPWAQGLKLESFLRQFEEKYRFRGIDPVNYSVAPGRGE
jgi:hypothetical protein